MGERRLIGWRVRYGSIPAPFAWMPKFIFSIECSTLEQAREQAVMLRQNGVADVKIMRVYRRTR